MKDSRYEEALERARAGKPLYEVFPELKESEDERIRTRLVALVEAFGQGKYKNEMLAYLEKQKEQRPLTTEETELNSLAFLEQMGYTCIPPGKEQKSEIRIKIPKFRVGDIIQHVPLESWDTSRKIISIDEHGYNFNLSHLGDTVSGGAIGFAFEDEFELVEQKPAEEEILSKLPDYTPTNLSPYIEHVPAEWSEDIIRKAVKEIGLTQHQIDWFKTNVFPPKQEWSEEDYLIFDSILSVVEEWENNQSEKEKEYYGATTKSDWLKTIFKSLRPQPHWKPSEEQVSILGKVFAGCELNTTERDNMVDLFYNLKDMI